MECRKCHFENPLGREVCGECGAKLENVCPKCSSLIPPEFKFCNECGYNLTFASQVTPKELSLDEKLNKLQRYLPTGIAEKVLAQRDKIEGERKHLTVMFCDLEGFTPLVEQLGAEEAYTIMDRVYELLIHKVHHYEGTVNEMTGDGIMALFGAPIALEDAPQHAVRSAHAIHRDMTKFSDQIREHRRDIPPLRLRIGIHSGPVVLGTLGNDLRVEFKAVGDTVNTAARMERLAAPGTTYVTEDIFKLTEGFFRFEPLGKKRVKGKEEPIPVYKVLSVKEDVHRPRLGSERKIYSRMVGRDRELAMLELQVMKMINGNGSVVNIIGEAGIGKSRLLAELKSREVMKKVNLFEARAINIGRNLSFHPIIDLLKRWAKIGDEDGEETAFYKLQNSLGTLYPAGASELLPFVATLMGMKLFGKFAQRITALEGEALEKLILRSLRQLLVHVTQLNPLVIVLEDLHWADQSTIKLMESLFRLTESRRILYINVFRPGYKDTGDRIIKTLKDKPSVYHVEIEIKPLNENDSEALITNMLEVSSAYHPAISQIIQRAGGNPFFIEEVVRSFLDQGAVVLKNGAFIVTEKINTIDIPTKINDVLMARIDRLAPKTRDLVKFASVIGRTFFYRILVHVATSVDDIDSKLSYLKDIELILERRRMDELEFLFKHALVREAAYHSLLDKKRKELHLTVADSIEKVFRERLHEFYGMLAYHYSRGENLDKTEEFLLKAGEAALKSSASNEALNYYLQALDLYKQKAGEGSNPDKIAMLEKHIAIALYNKGQFEDSVKYFEKALNFYWGYLPQYRITTLLKLLLAFFHLLIALYIPSLKFKKTPKTSDIEVVDLFYKKCKALGIVKPERFLIESLYIYKDITQFRLSTFHSALEIFVGGSALFSYTGLSFTLSRKILTSAQNLFQKDDVKVRIIYDFLQTMHHYLEGYWDKIAAYDAELVNNALDIGEIYFASQYLYYHGCLELYKGAIDRAKEIVLKLTDITEIYEYDFSLLLKYMLNTKLLLECRQLSNALKEVEEAIDFTQKDEFKITLLDLYSSKARIQFLIGNLEEAELSIKHADEIGSKMRDAPIKWSTFFRCELDFFIRRLETSMKTGNNLAMVENRTRAFKSSQMLLKKTKKAAQHRTEAYKLRGLYYWLVGSQNTAVKWWSKAIQEGERLGANLELARTYFEVGKRLHESKSDYETLNGIPAEEYLEKGRILFQQMDLQWDLDELNQLVIWQ